MIRYFIISDGSSDRLLIHPIDWLFRSKGIESKGERIDFAQSGLYPKTISEKIELAIFLYPDIKFLFVHRDAEKESIDFRNNEIESELRKAELEKIQTIKIIPIRMSEAWLLIDEKAIRKAAGKPFGKVKLNMPTTKRLEQLTNPKEMLKINLEMATEFSGRKKAQFDFNEARQLVGQYTEDFSPLRQLSAFQRLEADIDLLLKRI
jgi:hypothetical protein